MVWLNSTGLFTLKVTRKKQRAISYAKDAASFSSSQILAQEEFVKGMEVASGF
jgi:hypothetical protein